MDTSVAHLWRCWNMFRRGRRKTAELEEFQYHLETNLLSLSRELSSDTYRHGTYERFTVYENKKRDIVVAPLRDRIVHRAVYEELVPVFDKTFLHAVWSCRKGKGLLGAVLRTQDLMQQYRHSVIWRADVEKFFDHVNHDILFSLIKRRVKDTKTLSLIKEIIASYSVSCERESKNGEHRKGIPIGNLTSQIFSNIYLHEFDRFVVHTLKPKEYLRYGDDFILFACDEAEAIAFRTRGGNFLKDTLNLSLHRTNDVIIKARHGIRFLGMDIFPFGKRLRKRMLRKIFRELSTRNFASYTALLRAHGKQKQMKELAWRELEISNDIL